MQLLQRENEYLRVDKHVEVAVTGSSVTKLQNQQKLFLVYH